MKNNSIKCQVFGHFGKKKRACLKDKINELSTHNYIKNIEDLWKGIYKSEIGYKSRCNLVKDKKDDPLADSHNV
jgi:hypothetical protein